MEALIDITNDKSKNNNSNMELITLLGQKIEISILEDRKVIIDVSTPLMSCRNTNYIEDYEINEEYLYLNNGSYEIHIKLDEIEFKNDYFLNDNFTLLHNDTEINICFLE